VIGGGSSAGAVAGERRRRHRGSTTAAVRSPARGKAQLSNAPRTGLQCDLGEVLQVAIGLESRRRHELGKGCPAAAAGARTPASWRLVLSNKREGKLQGVLGHAGAARVGGASGWRVEFTVAAPMADGGGLRVARGGGRPAFIGKRALAKGSRESSHGGPRHGATAVQAASQWRLVGSAASQWQKAVRPPSACECGAWRRPGPKSTTHRSPLAPRANQGSAVCLGVRVRRSQGFKNRNSSGFQNRQNRSGKPVKPTGKPKRAVF
jgi:hypothetical protein